VREEYQRLKSLPVPSLENDYGAKVIVENESINKDDQMDLEINELLSDGVIIEEDQVTGVRHQVIEINEIATSKVVQGYPVLVNSIRTESLGGLIEFNTFQIAKSCVNFNVVEFPKLTVSNRSRDLNNLLESYSQQIQLSLQDPLFPSKYGLDGYPKSLETALHDNSTRNRWWCDDTLSLILCLIVNQLHQNKWCVLKSTYTNNFISKPNIQNNWYFGSPPQDSTTEVIIYPHWGRSHWIVVFLYPKKQTYELWNSTNSHYDPNLRCFSSQLFHHHSS
jgi:hypothetical protein